MIFIGVIICFFLYMSYAKKNNIKRKYSYDILLLACVSIMLGLISAMLFQLLFDSLKENSTNPLFSMTFFGGLVGGVITFILGYFLYIKKRYPECNFTSDVLVIAPACITVAHGFGRVGCLFAGCCHGSPTDAWFGIAMHGDMGYIKYVPVQLFEALFLFALFAFLFYNARKGRSYNLAVYAIGYGIWRFCIEYARADYRGSIPFVNVTPSQLIAVVMVALGIGLVFLEKFITGRQKGEQNNGAE
jgi:phosphatidylglycerol:prolipoprotein diacylglycerol transferase